MKKHIILSVLIAVTFCLSSTVVAQERDVRTVDTETRDVPTDGEPRDEDSIYIVTLDLKLEKSRRAPYERIPEGEADTNTRRKELATRVTSMSREVAASVGVEIRSIYDYVLYGFSARLTPEAVERLARDQRIKKVIPATTIYQIDQVQNNPPSWGLDRIDERTLI